MYCTHTCTSLQLPTLLASSIAASNMYPVLVEKPGWSLGYICFLVAINCWQSHNCPRYWRLDLGAEIKTEPGSRIVTKMAAIIPIPVPKSHINLHGTPEH